MLDHGSRNGGVARHCLCVTVDHFHSVIAPFISRATQAKLVYC